MPLLAVVAVALCAAMVLIVWSVMGGFLNSFLASGRQMIGDVTIAYGREGIPHYQQFMDMLEEHPDIDETTPTIETLGLVSLPFGESKDVVIVGVEPEVMGYGPVPAAEKALAKAGLTIDDIGLFELNEAFAVQVVAFLDHFGIPDDSDKVNKYGGAIATGHPLASSGVRLMNQFARQFEENPDVRYGMTAMCIGIGMGGAVIWENPHHADYGKEN